MNWLDFALNVSLLALVPFLLAAYGGHLAAENISDSKRRRRSKGIFWALCVIGIAVAALWQFRTMRTEGVRNKVAEENERRRNAAELESIEAQGELSDSEKANSKKLLYLQGQLNTLLLRPQPESQKIDEIKLKSEVTAAINDKVSSAPRSRPIVVQQPSTEPQPKAHFCRSDALQDCSDEELLEWEKPLVASIEAVLDQHSRETKDLDNINGASWLGQLVGLPDKNSRQLKALEQAERKSAERFADCCAANALMYHKEVLQRTGGDEQANLYRWVEDLTKGQGSKEHKKAMQDSRVTEVLINIIDLQIGLRKKVLEANLRKLEVSKKTLMP